MPFKHKVYYALALLHLLMVSVFTSHFAEWGNTSHTLSKKFMALGDYTGSNNIFSFFAPALSDQPYVVYTVKDTTGNERIIDLKGKSPDFANRINNIYGYLTLEESRSIFSATLASFVSRKYTSASKVRVAMVIQQIPDMNAFRDGRRCQWRFWFHRDFETKNASVAKH